MLTNEQYNEIMKNYNYLSLENQHSLEKRRNEIYKKIPRIKEIDMEISDCAKNNIEGMLSSGSSNTDFISNLKNKISLLKNEKIDLLKKNNYPSNYLEKQFRCNLCQDTGYVNGKKCDCFKKQEIDILFNQSNLKTRLEKTGFEYFSFDYYSDKIGNGKNDQAVNKSPRELAIKAYEKCLQFVKNFDSAFSNLFLYGNVGLGKTFLSNSIAHELLNSGHSVLYYTASDLIDTVHSFNKNYKISEDEKNLFTTCELLIIDDLGTEYKGEYNISILFNILNKRIMNQRSTIISTNYSVNELTAIYTSRLTSRILGNYELLLFRGQDIRVQKALAQINNK